MSTEAQAAGVPARTAPRPAVRWPDAVSRGATTVIATGTVAYHLALLTGAGVAVLTLVWIALTLGTAALLGWLRRRTETDGPTRTSGPAAEPAADSEPATDAPSRVRFAAAGAGAVAALVALLPGTPALASAALLGGAVAAMVVAWRDASVLPEAMDSGLAGRLPVRVMGRLEELVIGAWALLFALIASVVVRWDGDDAYYVNFSTWVAERGSIPTRDTMFSDQVFPALASHAPNLASWEALLGAVARYTGVPAVSVTYLLVPPVFAALAVVALAVALRALAIGPLALTLSAACAFLLVDGNVVGEPVFEAAFGNIHLLRIWQGKVVFVAILVPLLVAALRDLVVRGRQVDLARAVLCSIAAVGATSTAVIIVPLIAAAAAPAALRHGAVRRVALLAPVVVYPLLCGVLFRGGADVLVVDAPDARTEKILHFATIGGLHAAFYAAVLTFGWLGARRSSARLVLVGCVAVFAATTVQPVLSVLQAATGAQAVLWRLWWVVPFPVLVAGACAAFVRLARSMPWRVTATALIAAAFAGIAVQAATMTPRFSQTFVEIPPSWKTTPQSVQGAALVRSVARRGETVLAPWDVSRIVAVSTTEIHAVVPRTSYLGELAAAPGFDARTRWALGRFADFKSFPARQLGPALQRFDVSVVCLRAQRTTDLTTLESLGYKRAAARDGYACVRR